MCSECLQFKDIGAFSEMQPLDIAETLAAISPPRLSTYRSMFAPASDLELYGIYCWNETVSNGFSTLLATVEITLRNAFHRELSRRYGSPAAGPHTHWYDFLALAPRSAEKIREIRGHYRWRRYPPTPDDIVAGLSFGFWKHLLDVTHALDGTPILLNEILADLLPNYPSSSAAYWSGQARQDKFYSRLDTVLDMRNRIAHHEPIWKFGVLLEERRQRHRYRPAQIRNRPTSVAQALDRMNLTYNRSFELLHWLSAHRAADYKASPNHYKMRYMLSPKGIVDFKSISAKKDMTLLGIRRMMKSRTPLEQIIYLRHQGQPAAVILPWMIF